MKIEILYPQICCLYGDKGNTKLLQYCLPEAEFIYTDLNDKPAFLEGDVDLCCMYSMSEQSQELALDRLMAWKDDISNIFHNGKTTFLFLGNSMELLGKYIEREDGSRVEGLNVFDIYSVRHTPNRRNTLLKLNFEQMELLGYTSRFSDVFGITEDIAMAEVQIGVGSDGKGQIEGIRKGNIIATYMLGPLLVSNPDFTKWLLKKIGCHKDVLPFEEDLYKAYDVKKKEFHISDLEMD